MYDVVLYQHNSKPKMTEVMLGVKDFLTKTYGKAFMYVHHTDETLYPAKVFVMWGTVGADRASKPIHARVFEYARQRKIDVVIIEHGSLDRKKRYSVTVNDIVNFPTRVSVNVPRDPIMRFHVPIRETHPRTEGPVLFCGQLGKDAQIRIDDYSRWVRDTLLQIKRECQLEACDVMFREHPKSTIPVIDRDWASSHGVDIQSCKVPLINAMSRARVVVAYNSTCLVDAVLNGCPVVCLGPGSLVQSVVETDIRRVLRPSLPTLTEVQRLVCSLTHTEWTAEELRQGSPFACIRQMIQSL